ncbi:transcriptional regulator, putative [Roseobacter sp. SK209-2-6]|uniref:winged helix-turn-helix transcriptional regulator n=1 Tax=Roseobacter sp. SK209-2-6 TaxID=388739 RepID=UPI0000F3D0B3|nr:helix-turn-helix domain-containing protein [Roseobacter sp. SK209-2-6]EBA15132.1 transcriptional regulator, putative [Roseobacter sp. SK209-2-6]
MKWHDLSEEACPLARAMGVVGDRWTLLILRECFLGVRRFDHYQKRLGITRHLLAERLKRLESMGLLEKRPYQERPLRHEYRLTMSGKEFAPVLLAMQHWAQRNLPSEEPMPFAFVSRESEKVVEPVVTDRDSGEELNHRTVLMVPADPEAAKAIAKHLPQLGWK